MQTLFKFLYILLITSVIFSQQNNLNELHEKYVNFEYRQVIDLAEQMLLNDIYSKNELVQIYEMKGISHYSLGEEQKARQSFLNLLEQDNNYAMDPQQISPKIISFFNDIKTDFQAEIEEEKPILDSLNNVRKQFITSHSNYRSAVVKNLIIPGWGQFQLKNTTKGFVYGLLGISSAATAVYYIIETGKKRSDYLNETNINFIQAKYDKYNDAYKKRNLFITAAIAVWVASQLDILFFSEDNSIPEIGASFGPGMQSDINLNFSIPFN